MNFIINNTGKKAYTTNVSAYKIEITGTKKLCDFKHMFSPIDSPNEITPIKSKGFYLRQLAKKQYLQRSNILFKY